MIGNRCIYADYAIGNWAGDHADDHGVVDGSVCTYYPVYDRVYDQCAAGRGDVGCVVVQGGGGVHCPDVYRHPFACHRNFCVDDCLDDSLIDDPADALWVLPLGEAHHGTGAAIAVFRYSRESLDLATCHPALCLFGGI